MILNWFWMRWYHLWFYKRETKNRMNHILKVGAPWTNVAKVLNKIGYFYLFSYALLFADFGLIKFPTYNPSPNLSYQPLIISTVSFYVLFHLNFTMLIFSKLSKATKTSSYTSKGISAPWIKSTCFDWTYLR